MSPTSTATGRRAYGLLTLTALLWAGNAAAEKMAVACAALAVFARRPLLAEWDRIVPSWRRVLAMGACGYTIYASPFYAAGTLTRGVNLALLQGAIPVLVILLNFAVYRRVVTWGQGVGVAITLLGAAVAASHGDWRVLATLAFNRGDLLMLAACVLYAGYTVALPSRPKVSSLTFFTAMAAAALATSLPLLLAEWAAGQTIWPTPKGWLIVAFVGLGPSLAAQLFFMRGVELIGPNRAGVFVNLVPVFGAALAVLLVGEPFGWNDALALALVLGGILVAERLGRRPAP